MIYLDNSATTYPKPPSVIRAVNTAMRSYGFNPGRGGYNQSIRTSAKIYETRSAVKSFFNAPDEESVIFTSGCTQSLNTVIKGVLKRGDHVVISSFEHNAVLRPLHKLYEEGYITYSVARVIPGDDDKTLDNFRNAVNGQTRLFICTHASNVFGIRLPAARICALAHSYNILFCLDAAQSAGLLDIDIMSDGYDYVCCAGHKYLYGPMGTGLLIIGNKETALNTLIEGGTGSNSAEPVMPDFVPDRFEAGTPNIPGIIGLGEGIRFVNDKGIDKIYAAEKKLLDPLRSRLNETDRVTVYGDGSGVPVLSFSVENADSEAVARYLSETAGIAVRSGIHCAPMAHETMGTSDSGTIRIAPSVFTVQKDIQILFNSLRKMLSSA